MWEITILTMQTVNRIRYKVTKRLPRMAVAETRIFRDKEKAKQLLEEWIANHIP